MNNNTDADTTLAGDEEITPADQLTSPSDQKASKMSAHSDACAHGDDIAGINAAGTDIDRGAVGHESTDPDQMTNDEFDKPVRVGEGDQVDIDALIVNIDGYEGPLDVLLDLARTQKVDLRKISILPLVEQYLAFVEAAKAQKLELAADYLVMASWLTFLKTKLLLPAPAEAEEEPTADEMAARLAFQLQRLEAMRTACDRVFNLPQRGSAFFPRGIPSGVVVEKKTVWKAELYDLLKAYAKQRVAGTERTYQIKPPAVYSIEDARKRLSRVLGRIPDWVDLSGLALSDAPEAPRRSVIASAFNAALEFAKDGKMEIRQVGHYEPLYVRQRSTPRKDDRIANLSSSPHPVTLLTPES
ncbi:MAG: ScpA family protein [Pseudomonadota bacterium]